MTTGFIILISRAEHEHAVESRCTMISLIISLLVLVAGYLIYGRIVEQVFAPDFSYKTRAV